MRDKPGSMRCLELKLSVDFGARTGESYSKARSARKTSAQSRKSQTRPQSATTSITDDYNYVPVHSPSSPHHDHECVQIDQPIEDNVDSQLASKGILVGSALRRPHASQYTPLDYQTLPQAGRTPRLPYQTNSAGTVYHYVKRPMSAVEQSRQLGRQTKASLLRSQSSSILTTKKLSVSNLDKRLCIERDDYRLCKTGVYQNQTAPHGQTLHAFLTGARYNCNQFLDARTLTKLGVYIPRHGLNSFFLKLGEKPKLNKEGELLLDSTFSEDEEDSTDDITLGTKSAPSTRPSTAVQTDEHYYSINYWHNADWSVATRKEKPKLLKTKEQKSAENLRCATRRSRPIKACYLDYNTLTPVRGRAIEPQTGSGVSRH